MYELAIFMKVMLYSRSDAILIMRRGIYADIHRHHGIQITFAVNGCFEAEVNGQRGSYKALVIDSDCPHRVIGQDDWVITLLLNPETPLAKAVQRHVLRRAASRSLDVRLRQDIRQLSLSYDLLCPALDLILDHVTDLLLPGNTAKLLPDSRIKQVLDIVQRSTEYKISAKELSNQIYLSESRLGHLFKAEVGIPLRRYLLWCRLVLATRIIAQGENYTFAAHETGFTDSAHLSRTFSAMFGLRLSDMFGDRSMIRVAFCDG